MAFFNRNSDRPYGNRPSTNTLATYAVSLAEEAPPLVFIPMFDANNEPCHVTQVSHTVKEEKRSNRYACTQWNDFPQFNRKCHFCGEIRRFDEEGVDFRDRDIFIDDIHFIGVWDPNYYIPEKKDNKTRYSLFVPRRRGGGQSTPPAEAVLGGKRFFQMGKNTWEAFTKYEGRIQDTCRCVAKTGEPKISTAYVRVAKCPRCGYVVADQDLLDQIQSSKDIRLNVLQQLHKCVSKDAGGCWTNEDEKAGVKSMFYPVPEYGCVVNDRDPSLCDKPEALEIIGRPALVTRKGTGYQTVYDWARDDSISWRDWIDYMPPTEAIEAFASGFNVSLTLKSPIQQAKMLNIKPDNEDLAQSREYSRSASRDPGDSDSGASSRRGFSRGGGDTTSEDDNDDGPVFRRPR